jgi:ABC-type polysaccharide/polyol phosphate export permease
VSENDDKIILLQIEFSFPELLKAHFTSSQNSIPSDRCTETRRLTTFKVAVKVKSCYYPDLQKRLPGTYFLRNLVGRRALLFQLVKRDFQQRYVGSAAGWIWGIIHPLVLLASYWFIFGYILKIVPNKDLAHGNYALFLFAGMLPWLLFSETLSRSTSSMLDQANLITKTVFPAEIVPISIFLSAMVSHLLAVTMLFVAVAMILHQVTFWLLLLPLFSALLGLLAVGLSWISSSLQVYLRDTIQVVTVILIFWQWTTPIFIEESKFPQRAHLVVVLNPITYVVRCYRNVLLSASPPALDDLAVLCGISMCVFVLGGLFFRHMKRGFADVL